MRQPPFGRCAALGAWNDAATQTCSPARDADEPVDVGMSARVGSGIRSVFGVEAKTLRGRGRVDALVFPHEVAIHGEGSRLARLVLDDGTDFTGIVQELEALDVIHRCKCLEDCSEARHAFDPRGLFDNIGRGGLRSRQHARQGREHTQAVRTRGER